MRNRPARRYSPRSNRHAEPETSAVAVAALDGSVVTAVSLLASIGLIAVYSITAPRSFGDVPVQFTRHLAALAAAGVLGFTALRLPLQFWRRIAIPMWGVCVLVLVATLFAGIEVNGATRWIGWQSLRLQPAEFAKLATVLAAAAMLSNPRSRQSRLKPTISAAAMCALPIVLLLKQPDFGSALIIAATVGMLLFASGVHWRPLSLAAGIGLAGTACYVALRPYAYARFTGFLDPWATASREGFQLVQSFVAFSRGGTFGVPLGGGRQKLYYLPEAHTDFILSGIAEEAGVVGVLLVLGLFAAFVAAGMRIAARATDTFAALVAFGMTALIGLPAAINAAVVMGMLPTTGFTLPFVSFGANSLIVCALAVGILLRIGAREAAPRRARVSGASRREIGAP